MVSQLGNFPPTRLTKHSSMVVFDIDDRSKRHFPGQVTCCLFEKHIDGGRVQSIWLVVTTPVKNIRQETNHPEVIGKNAAKTTNELFNHCVGHYPLLIN